MIQGLGHLALFVTDIQRALEFYRDKLGLEVLFTLPETGEPWLYYIKVAHGQYIELFPTEELRLSDKPNFAHFCFHVEGIREIIEELREKGVEVTKEVQLGLDGNLQAWIKDPDGTPIELMERMPEGKQRQLDPA